MVKLLKKFKFIHFFWFFLFLLIFGILLRNSLKYLDPDLGWHLRVGQEIVETGAVPHLNHFNYTYTGSWVDHEWLSNVLVYKIYSQAGYLALNMVLAFLALLIFIILTIFIRQTQPKIPMALIVILELFGLIACLPHWGVRIQELGSLFLLLTLIIIHAYNQNKNFYLLFCLWPLFYFWANLHASFLIGLFVLFFFLAVKIAEKVIRKYKSPAWLDLSGPWQRPEIIIFSLFTLGSVLATMLTPYKLELYSFLFGYRDTVYLKYIQEWQSQFSFPFNYWQMFYLALATAMLGLYFYYTTKKKYQSLNLWSITSILFFFLLTLSARRNFPLFFIISFIAFAAGINSLIEIKQYSWSKLINIWLKFLIIACFFLVIASQAARTNQIRDPFVFFSLDYPYDAVNFLKSKPIYARGNMLNDYGWGGYLIWRYPERQLFIDGRLPQVQFAGHSFLSEYLEFFKSTKEANLKLAEYDISLVILKVRDGNIGASKLEKFIFGIQDKDLRAKNYLRESLNSNPNWKIIYTDLTAVIYSKIN